MAEDPKFVVHGSQVQKWTDDIQKLKQECDSLRNQKDKLIDEMAEIKKKAETFDIILEFVDGNVINVGDSVKRIIREYYRKCDSDEEV